MKSELENYHIKRIIAEGQFGKVIEVQDRRDRTVYALKVVSFEENPNIKKCLKEVQVLGKLGGHPNIVQYKHCWLGETSPEILNSVTKVSGTDEEYDEEDSFVTSTTESAGSSVSEICHGKFLFIKTELCDMNLRTWMKNHLKPHYQNKGIGPILSLFFQIASAVKFIHLNRVVHRDLKPENIFITKRWQSWRITVGDFGNVCQALTKNQARNAKISNNIYGTPPYTAPEMLTGDGFDGRADVYSMAVILLELLYPMATLMEKAQGIQALRQNKPTSDKDFETFLQSHPKEVSKLREMLSKIPEKRPKSTTFHTWLRKIKDDKSPEQFRCCCHY